MHHEYGASYVLQHLLVSLKRNSKFAWQSNLAKFAVTVCKEKERYSGILRTPTKRIFNRFRFLSPKK